MKFFQFEIVISILIGSAFCVDINVPGCGRRPRAPNNDDPNKIVGGVEAAFGDWGWQASVLYQGNHKCGGSLINKDWIITAGHCAPDLWYADYTIVLGQHNRGSTNETWVQSLKITKLIRHELWVSSTLKYDITLMKLQTPANIDNNYIIPVCVHTGSADLSGQTAYATGWGTLFAGGTLATTLRQADLLVTTDSTCRSFYGSRYDPATMICAGEVGDNKDTCQGDSGGPLVYQNPNDGLWYLIGITSWGYGCGDIGVYGRVSSFESWIRQQQ